MTVVVADTGELEAIRRFKPRDATTNPSLILAAAQIPAYQNLIDEVLESSRDRIGHAAAIEEVVEEALDEICVAFGNEILKIIPGRVSTEVDARLSYDEEGTIMKGGVKRSRSIIRVQFPDKIAYIHKNSLEIISDSSDSSEEIP